MTLPNDIARCHGQTLNNEKAGKPLPPCLTCKRRLQIALDPPTANRVVYTSPPEFDNGNCPIKISK